MVASVGPCLSLVLAAAGGFYLVQATATGRVEAHLPRGVYTQKKKKPFRAPTPKEVLRYPSSNQPSTHLLKSCTGSPRLGRFGTGCHRDFDCISAWCLHSLLSTQMSRRWTADTMSLGLRRRLQQFLLLCDVMFVEVSPLTVFTSRGIGTTKSGS